MGIIEHREQAAIAALVKRHGPMVLLARYYTHKGKTKNQI
jgi:hypothetical protein